MESVTQVTCDKHTLLYEPHSVFRNSFCFLFVLVFQSFLHPSLSQQQKCYMYFQVNWYLTTLSNQGSVAMSIHPGIGNSIPELLREQSPPQFKTRDSRTLTSLLREL